MQSESFSSTCRQWKSFKTCCTRWLTNGMKYIGRFSVKTGRMGLTFIFSFPLNSLLDANLGIYTLNMLVHTITYIHTSKIIFLLPLWTNLFSKKFKQNIFDVSLGQTSDEWIPPFTTTCTNDCATIEMYKRRLNAARLNKSVPEFLARNL